MRRILALVLMSLVPLAAHAANDGASCSIAPDSAIAPLADAVNDAAVFGQAQWVCNDGAMTIYRPEAGSETQRIVVSDQGVIDWFVAQSQTTETGPSYYGGDATVTKAFPWMVSIEGTGSARRMVIRDFHEYLDGTFLTSGPQGASAYPIGSGFKLRVDGGHMPNSHTMINYTVGLWYFENCKQP